MDCEKDVLRIQKKLDKIVKEELVKHCFILCVARCVSSFKFNVFVYRAKTKH